MKIALVTPGGVDRSGEQRVIPALLWLIERLAREHELHVYALNQEREPGDWELLGAHVHNVGDFRGRGRRLWARFAAEHRVGRFDVIQAFFGDSGAYAAPLGWRFGVPVALHAAGGEFVGFRDIGYGMRATWTGRVAISLAIAGADAVTVATGYMQQLARQRGVPTVVVPLGVALDRWPAAEPRTRESGQPARLLQVADLRPVKDQQMLMAAAEQLLADGVPFELDVAGYDTTGGALERSPAAQRLGGAVRWHGLLDRRALRALVDRADLLVVTSRHEAGPLAVLEAAVAGVPTVGTNVGHVADWSPDAAVAVPASDPEALANAVRALLADEPRRLALASEAQARALAIDADVTASEFEAIYRALAGQE